MNNPFENLIKTLERWAEDNTVRISDVELFGRSWRKSQGDHIFETIQEIENLENLFISNYALEEAGYNKGLIDCIEIIKKNFGEPSDDYLEVEDSDTQIECLMCNGYGEIFDDSDLSEPHKDCEKCSGEGFL